MGNARPTGSARSASCSGGIAKAQGSGSHKRLSSWACRPRSTAGSRKSRAGPTSRPTTGSATCSGGRRPSSVTFVGHNGVHRGRACLAAGNDRDFHIARAVAFRAELIPRSARRGRVAWKGSTERLPAAGTACGLIRRTGLVDEPVVPASWTTKALVRTKPRNRIHDSPAMPDSSSQMTSRVSSAWSMSVTRIFPQRRHL